MIDGEMFEGGDLFGRGLGKVSGSKRGWIGSQDAVAEFGAAGPFSV